MILLIWELIPTSVIIFLFRLQKSQVSYAQFDFSRSLKRVMFEDQESVEKLYQESYEQASVESTNPNNASTSINYGTYSSY